MLALVSTMLVGSAAQAIFIPSPSPGKPSLDITPGGGSLTVVAADVAGADAYQIKWRVAGTNPYTFLPSNTSGNFVISGLTPGVQIEVAGRAQVGGQFGGWTIGFATPLSGGTTTTSTTTTVPPTTTTSTSTTTTTSPPTTTTSTTTTTIPTTTTQPTTTTSTTTTIPTTTTSPPTTTSTTTTVPPTTTTSLPPNTRVFDAPNPSQPGLVITAGPEQLAVTATGVPGATSFQFRYRLESGPTYVWLTPTANRQVTIPNLIAGQIYIVNVRALDGSWSGWTIGNHVPLAATPTTTTTVPTTTTTVPTTTTSTTTTTVPTTTTSTTTTTVPTTTTSTTTTTVPTTTTSTTTTTVPTTTTSTTTTTVPPTTTTIPTDVREFPAPTSGQPGLIITASPGAIDAEATGVPTATQFQFRWREEGTAMQWVAPSADRELSLAGLTPGVTHTVEVRALVGSTWSPWTLGFHKPLPLSTTTTTQAPTTTTTVPSTTTTAPNTDVRDFPAPAPGQPGLTITATPGALAAEATGVPTATQFQYRWREADMSTVWTNPSASRILTLTGLTPDVTHFIEVRALVGNAWSAWTVGFHKPLPLGGTTTTSTTSTTVPDGTPVVRTFPAPAPNQAAITTTATAGTLLVEAADVAGAVLYQFRYIVDGVTTRFLPSADQSWLLTDRPPVSHVVQVRVLINNVWQPWASGFGQPLPVPATTTTNP